MIPRVAVRFYWAVLASTTTAWLAVGCHGPPSGGGTDNVIVMADGGDVPAATAR